jgi:integrase
MPKSTRRPRKDKPAKPRSDFPLFAHATKRWAKKIRGKMHYFGPWDDPEGSLNRYLEQRDDLFAGRKPRPKDDDRLTLQDLVNHFLTHKRNIADAREITERTFAEYYSTCELLIGTFGDYRVVSDLRPDDFEALRAKLVKKKWGPVTLGNAIQRVRTVFRYADAQDLVERPVRFGAGFAKPSRKTMRLERARKGSRMFEATEIRMMVDGVLVVGKEGPELFQASPQLRAMFLLGVNCGFGNADCGTLPVDAVDLAEGWVNYHRPKTGITRRCPLWPETVSAVKEALAVRPDPKDPRDAGLVFLTKQGRSWAKAGGMVERDGKKKPKPPDNPVSKETRKVLDALRINGHRSFYALRHTLETIGGEARDQVAVDAIMGHVRDDMASVYRERISDERLKAVSDRVRRWLFPEATQAVVGLQHLA